MSIKISRETRDRVFFTSDQHYGHDNVIKFCCRPFKDVREMNEELIRRHNAVVPPNGVVFHLGDFAVGRDKGIAASVKARLNGAEHHLIEGNHEKLVTGVPLARGMFTSIKPYESLYVEDEDAKDGARQFICLFHYPISEWDKQHHAAWSLFGHQHYNGVVSPYKRLDVGVDNPLCEYGPLSYDAVKAYMRDKTYTPLDKEKKLGANA